MAENPIKTSTPRKRATKKKIHPAVQYFRSIGFVSLLLGGAGLIFAEHFLIAIGLVYSGIVALAIDLCFEPWFRQAGWIVKTIGVLVVLGVLIGFSYSVVFVPAPLDMNAYVFPNEYAPGTMIAGYRWVYNATDLRLEIKNDSDGDYDKLDLDISTDMVFTHPAQITKIPNVSFWRPPGPNLLASIPIQGRDSDMASSEPMTESIRVRCETLPMHTTMILIIPVIKPRQMIKTEWIGGEPHFLESPIAGKRDPDWVKVKGQFKAAMRIRNVEWTQNPVPARQPSL